MKFIYPCFILSLALSMGACSSVPSNNPKDIPRVRHAPSTETQGIPSFFRDNKCESLAAWVKPLQSEFPGAKIKSEDEVTVRTKYALLFSDDYFVPFFGKPIDALSGRQLKKIGGALNFNTRICKGHESADVKFFLSLYPGSFLSRPFNLSLKHTPLSYDYVVAHAQSRRVALAPLGLGSGVKPSTEQLIQIASPEKPIFHLLWPSEKREIATYDQIKPSGTSTEGQLGTEQPQGQWVGLGLCRREYQEMTVDIQRLPGRLAGKLHNSVNSFDFELVPAGKGVYNVRSDSSAFGEKATIYRTQGFLPILSMQVFGGCSRLVAIRFQPIEGLGGRYAKVSDQKSFCKDVVDEWLYRASERLSIATRLKEEFYPVLNGYDAQSASRMALFSDAVISDTFGIKRSQFGNEQLAGLKRQIAGCVLMKSRDYGNGEVTNSLFTPSSIAKVRKQVFNSLDVSPLQMTDSFGSFISGKENNKSSSKSAAELLSGWDSLVQRSDSVSALEEFVRERAYRLSEFDPAEVKLALHPIGEHLRSARLKEHRQNNAGQRGKYQKSLESANIPYSQLEAPFRRILKSLAEGQPVQMDAGTMLFFGGLAGHYLENCKSSLSTKERLPIAQFVGSSVLRAGMGADYSNSNFGQTMGGQTIFVGGQQSAKIIGCGAADPMLSLVADVIKSNETDDEGREPPFIRSCAPDHGLAKCQCLAKVGSAAIPNIHQRRYTRNTIPRIIKMNPIVGMQIIGACGIVNY